MIAVLVRRCRQGSWASAREMARALVRTRGASVCGCTLPCRTTSETAAMTVPRASCTGAATDSASIVTCRSLTENPDFRTSASM